MAIGIKVEGGRFYGPRDGKARFKGREACNEHPAHRGGAVSDVQAEVLGISSLAGEVLRNHQKSVWAGALTPVDVSAGKATNDGRGPSVEDAPFLSLKMADSGKTGGTAGACVLTTLREATARAFLAHPRAADVAVLTILAPKDGDGVYIVDPTCVRWHVGHPFAELAAGGLDAAFGRATGRGRPAKGAVLPDSWAGWVATDCADGRSAQLSFRHPRTDGHDGWTVGTLDQVRAVALALASRK
jgi:hypothetical protein